MGLLLLLAKPALYVVAFALAHRRFGEFSSPSGDALPGPLRRYFAVGSAALARLVLGVAGFFSAQALLGTRDGMPFTGVLIGLGFLWWLLVAKVTFARTPWPNLLGFAAIAEILSAVIDLAAMAGEHAVRMC